MALVALERAGRLSAVVTQNVDGLHERSGLPRAKLAVLHGCVFAEQCEACGGEVLHARDLGGLSRAPTGRLCAARGCAALPETARRMRDTLLDWEDALPEVTTSCTARVALWWLEGAN